MISSIRVKQTRQSLWSEPGRFDFKAEVGSKPRKSKGRKNSRSEIAVDGAIIEAKSLLYKRLEAIVQNQCHYNMAEIASLVSALSLARLAFPDSSPDLIESVDDEVVTYGPIPSESVVEYPENAGSGRLDAFDHFRWRKDLEILWKKHITKDELHQPVVRSLGVPVMTIVNHIRDGAAWDTIRKLYPAW